jgi:ferric-dicitrate binding protein FerR (iron transport regulator)
MNDAEPNPLRDQLDRLPREIPPARDLWPEIQAEVERLDPKTLSSAAPNALVSARSTSRRWRLPLAIAAALALAAGLHWWRPVRFGPSWKVDAMDGAPRIGRTVVTEAAKLTVGEWLETDAASRARVTVGTIGEVSLEPNSRLRLVNTAATDHRLELARGTMRALIWAPPRLFFVETPSATAVDLGCAYTLSVDDHGVGTLEVTSGYVALEQDGLASVIPAGLMCVTRPGFGPGTPFAVNTSAELRESLARFDAGNDNAVPRILAAAAPGDGVTLWHLLDRAPETTRGRVYDTLARLRPPPAGVTRPGILAGDTTMRDRWAEELGLFAGLGSNRQSP